MKINYLKAIALASCLYSTFSFCMETASSTPRSSRPETRRKLLLKPIENLKIPKTLPQEPLDPLSPLSPDIEILAEIIDLQASKINNNLELPKDKISLEIEKTAQAIHAVFTGTPSYSETKFAGVINKLQTITTEFNARFEICMALIARLIEISKDTATQQATTPNSHS